MVALVAVLSYRKAFDRKSETSLEADTRSGDRARSTRHILGAVCGRDLRSLLSIRIQDWKELVWREP